MRKVFKLLCCCNKRKQIKNDVFVSGVTGSKPGQVHFQDLEYIHLRELNKNQCGYYNIFPTIVMHLRMKYKQGMKFTVPWSLLPENIAQFFTTLYQVFHEYHNKECPLTKFKQFSQCAFLEISSQRLTTSPYNKSVSREGSQEASNQATKQVRK